MDKTRERAKQENGQSKRTGKARERANQENGQTHLAGVTAGAEAAAGWTVPICCC
jgi:hypothetical protein